MLTATPASAGHFWSDWSAPARDRTAQASTTPEAGSGRQRLITFVEPEESFLSQSIRNFGLTLATLGFYSFWARAEARKQLHRSIHIGGQRLDFTGTGREACISFLIGTLTTVIVVSTFLYFFRGNGGSSDQMRAALSDFRYRRLFISLPLIFLLGSAVYRRRKVLLRRTWWRGQHFDLDGQPYAYALQHFWTAFLVPLTLGWAAPWRASRLAHRKIREMHLGDERFKTMGGVATLYRAFATLWFGGGIIYVATMALLGLTVGPELIAAASAGSLAPLRQPGVIETVVAVLAIGLTPVAMFLLYYRAAWIEHQISSIVFRDMRFHIKLPKVRFAALILWNGFVKLISFGAFAPVADAALARFVIDRIETERMPAQHH